MLSVIRISVRPGAFYGISDLISISGFPDTPPSNPPAIHTAMVGLLQ